MDSVYSIDISADLETLLVLFKDAPDKVDKAVRRAMKKLSRYAERQILRALSRAHPLSQKQLKKLRRLRIKVFSPSHAVNDYVMAVYLGTNAIAAHYYGTPQQRPKGVKTGKQFWKGAFVVPGRGNDKPLVFKRSANWKHKYVRSRRSGRMMWMGLPMELQRKDIHDDAVSVMNALQPQQAERFSALVSQELNYAFNIE